MKSARPEPAERARPEHAERARPLLLLRQIRSLRPKGDTVPPAMHPVRWWSGQWGVSLQHAGKLCERAAAAGLMRRRTYRAIAGGHPGLVPLLHYEQIASPPRRQR